MKFRLLKVSATTASLLVCLILLSPRVDGRSPRRKGNADKILDSAISSVTAAKGAVSRPLTNRSNGILTFPAKGSPAAQFGCGGFPCPQTCFPSYDDGGATPQDWCTFPDTGCDIGYWADGGGCCTSIYSPILIDINGDGFAMTSAANGVWFDLNGDGVPQHISWTSLGSDDGWLFLDRNNNGLVDSGRELFGNFTPQPPSRSPNGFLALAEYDKPTLGGNGDGVIDVKDAVYPLLRLWVDANHDGVSQPSELHTLSDFRITGISLDYSEFRRTDAFGNQFKLRARVISARSSDVGRWAWDVFLATN